MALLVTAQRTLLPVMEHLEVERVQKQLRLGLNHFYDLVDQVQRAVEDLAVYDDSYEFMETRDPAFVASHLTDSTYTNLNLGFIVYLAPDGEVAYGGRYDFFADAMGQYPQELVARLLEEGYLLKIEIDETVAGLLQVGERNYILSAAHIVDSQASKPSRGILLAGRLLDPMLLDDFSADWGYDFELNKPVETDDPRGLFNVEKVGAEAFGGRFLLFDIFGASVLSVLAEFPRDFSLHGRQMIDSLLRWNLSICLVFSLMIYLVVDKALRARELRLETEDRFRRLSAEFEMILNGIPDPLMLISPGLDVIWANHAGAQLLADVSPSENGKYIANVKYEPGIEGRGVVALALNSRKNEQQKVEMEDGRIIKEYAYPLLDEQDVVVSIIRLASDITVESRLRREADQQSRLASIGELAAGVAHEINNPTGMLLLNLSLLTDVFYDIEPILDEVHDQDPDLELGRIPYPTLRKKIPYLLKEMTDGGQRIKRIVEDLKGFARRDDNREPESFDVNDVAEAAVRLVEYQLSKATAHFSVSLAEGLPRVHGHFRRIEQVLVNLLVNATQALENREQAIILRTRISHGGSRVVVEVEDRGRGIAPDVLDKVTDPFFTTRRNEGGTGLGLSLSARILKEHGGELRISSKPGSGSLFGLRLPHVEMKDETEQVS